MRLRPTVILVSSTALGLSIAPVLAGTATFQPLGDLPGGEFLSRAMHVSADGSTVVGYSKSSFASDPYEAFRWTPSDGMVGLGGLASPPDTQARGVSADGSVVILSAAGDWPILWTESGGLMELLDLSGTLVSATPFDLSADGATFVGVAQEASQPANQAFRWTAASAYEPLGWLPSTIHDSFMTAASADGSVLAGFSFHQGSDVEPMVWTALDGLQTLGDVPGGDPYALAWGISDDGTTVVGDAHVGGTSEPWLWRPDTGFVLPDPTHGAGGGGWFESVSEDGSVAVGVPAIIWDEDRGIRRLADILAAEGIDVSGWLLQSATDVSADGSTVVGYGRNPDGDTEAWIVRLPEVTTSAPDTREASGLELKMLSANPGSGATVFRLRVPEAGRVCAQIFSLDGRLVSTVLDGSLHEGTHHLQWNGRDALGQRVASGSYFLRVDTQQGAVTRKLVRVD